MPTYAEINEKTKRQRQGLPEPEVTIKPSISEEVLDEIVYNPPNKELAQVLLIAKKVQRINALGHIESLVRRYDAAIESLDVQELEDFVTESNKVAEKIFNDRT